MVNLPSWAKTGVGRAVQGVGNLGTALGIDDKNDLAQVGRNILNPSVNYLGKTNPVSSNPKNSSSPNPTLQSDPTTGVYTGGSGSGASASDIAYYNDQLANLSRLLGSADTQQAQGQQAIDNSYNKSADRLNQQQSQVLSGYATQRQDASAANQKNLAQIDANARNTYSSLQRLLGQAGSGVSSAAQIAAPYAVSLQGSQQRAGTQDTYAHNLRDLGTAEDQAKLAYKNELDDLAEQRTQKLRDLLQSIGSSKQSLLDSQRTITNQRNIAQGGSYTPADRAPQTQQINAIQSQLDNLFNQYRDPQYSVHDVQVQTPDLAQYSVDPAALNASATNPGYDQSVVDYLPQLLRQQRQNALY